MSFGRPGGEGKFTPTPPERGSFPLDHYGDCKSIAQEYVQCINLTGGKNSQVCRLLAKKYLKCRMDNSLMDKDEWKNLGLPEDPLTKDPDKC